MHLAFGVGPDGPTGLRTPVRCLDVLVSVDPRRPGDCRATGMGLSGWAALVSARANVEIYEYRNVEGRRHEGREKGAWRVEGE